MMLHAEKIDDKGEKRAYRKMGRKMVPKQMGRFLGNSITEKGSSEFVRRVYFYKNRPEWSYVLIKYKGDNSVFEERPHGNSKKIMSYKRTASSVLTSIRNEVPSRVIGSTKDVVQIYSKNQADTQVNAEHQGILNPRNSKQVKNTITSERKKLKLSHDELFSTVQLAVQLQDFVHECNYFPDLRIVLGATEVLNELNSLYTLKSDEPVILSYDTTFNIGSNFLSPLVFKHVMFKGGKTIPVAFLIHDRKNRITHETFFRVIANLIPNLEKMATILVTDRELAISGAIKRVFPRMKVLFCWNHMRKDFKRWLVSQKATQDDMAVYPKDF